MSRWFLISLLLLIIFLGLTSACAVPQIGEPVGTPAAESQASIQAEVVQAAVKPETGLPREDLATVDLDLPLDVTPSDLVEKLPGDSPAAPPVDPIAPPRPQRQTPTAHEQVVADAARAFLADALEADETQVVLVSIQPVDWPDASLGCPQPDMMYAQVITPGYQVALRAGHARYELHTDQTGQQVVSCSTGTQGERLRLPPEAARDQEALVKLAQGHLAGLLGVSLEDVNVIAVEQVDLQDVRLSCPAAVPSPPGKQPDQAFTDDGAQSGYHIVLDVDGVAYHYYTDGSFLIFCGQ